MFKHMQTTTLKGTRQNERTGLCEQEGGLKPVTTETYWARVGGVGWIKIVECAVLGFEGECRRQIS